MHIVKEETSNPQTGQVFPPPYLKTEEWFEVNAEGYVMRSVHTDYNDSGQIIQQAATIGDYSVNFTTGDSGYNNADSYKITMYELTGYLSRAGQNGVMDLSTEETTCENQRNCLLVSHSETFSTPIQNPGETEEFYGAGQRFWIDLETGQLVKRQTFWLLEDGSEAISSSTIYTLVEKVGSPPQEILDILNSVIVP